MNFFREKVKFKENSIYCPSTAIDLSNYTSHLTFAQKIKSFIYFLYLRNNKKLYDLSWLNSLENASILIASGSNLGGAIMTIPLFRAIKSRYPNLQIVALANRKVSLDALRIAGVADHYITVPEKTFIKSLYSYECLKFRRKIKKLNPCAFISNFDFKLNHILPLKKINIRVGNIGISPLNENLNDCFFMFTHRVEVKNKNWLDIYNQISLFLECKPLMPPKINLDVDYVKKFEIFLNLFNADIKLRYISIQADVSSAETYKAWPYLKVAELCYKLYSKQNIVPIILGAPNQNDLSTYLREHFPNVFFIDAVGKTNISLLSIIIKSSCLTFANDSGIMHLSASLDVPTVAIYGMTDPDVTNVYKRSNKLRIIRNTRCKPCFAFPKSLMLSCKLKPCLNDISVDEVFSTINEMINK